MPTVINSNLHYNSELFGTQTYISLSSFPPSFLFSLGFGNTCSLCVLATACLELRTAALAAVLTRSHTHTICWIWPAHTNTQSIKLGLLHACLVYTSFPHLLSDSPTLFYSLCPCVCTAVHQLSASLTDPRSSAVTPHGDSCHLTHTLTETPHSMNSWDVPLWKNTYTNTNHIHRDHVVMGMK